MDLSRGAAAASRRSTDADTVAFFLPMHTATRLALPVIDRVRALNPGAVLCAYGLYAPLNAVLLRERGITAIIGGEFEDDLAALAHGPSHDARSTSHVGTSHVGTSHVARTVSVPRVHFAIPLRDSLPPLTRYASLQKGDERVVASATPRPAAAASTGADTVPIVPVYDGRFRVVDRDIVIADIRQQVAAGAGHITFGDPDFFNGPRHAVDIVRAFASEFPGVSYDVTIKVEHLIQHADLLPLLRDTGCAFVTSAVESVDDDVLRRLEKGHTAQISSARSICAGTRG